MVSTWHEDGVALVPVVTCCSIEASTPSDILALFRAAQKRELKVSTASCVGKQRTSALPNVTAVSPAAGPGPCTGP